MLELLKVLAERVQEKERKKGKRHQVFRLSFDAKLLEGEKEILEVMAYIHHNPVSGKWCLAEDFTKYNYSSAAFYELHVKLMFLITESDFKRGIMCMKVA